MDEFIAIIVLIIALVTCWFWGFAAAPYMKTYPTIAECEANLPRNQTCHMVAVVKEDSE